MKFCIGQVFEQAVSVPRICFSGKVGNINTFREFSFFISKMREWNGVCVKIE